jgi:hypothetical protein
VVLRVWIGVPVGVGPDQTLTVTAALSPGAVPAVPANDGVGFPLELPSAGDVRTIAGPVVSMTNVTGALWPRFPARSDCSACAVYVPSWSAAALTEYAPKESRVVVSVCTGVPTGAEPA